jgi:hypothetical protein
MNMDPDAVETMEASPEIIDEVTVMLRKKGIRALQEAEQYIRKSKGKPLKKIDLRAEFTKRLSSYITQGMVRLTIEKVIASDEVQQSEKDTHSPYTIVLKKIAPLKLPEYSPYITIAIGSGAAELFRTDATFVVKSAIVLQNTRITLHEKKFREFRFGSLNAAMSIYLKKDQVTEQLHSFSRDLTIPGFMSQTGP